MASTDYYRQFLSGVELEAYDRILDCWNYQSPAVRLPFFPNDLSTDSTTIVKAVALDHPEIYWVNYYQFSEIRQLCSTSLAFSYYMNSSERCKAEASVSRWKEYIMSYIQPSSKPVEKLWMLYDYLRRQVHYAEREPMFSHTLLGCVPVYGHSAVCEGIAKCYKFLADSAGLPCTIITGNIMAKKHKICPHAWNMVQTTNRRLHIDLLHPSLFLKDDSYMTDYTWERR